MLRHSLTRNMSTNEMVTDILESARYYSITTVCLVRLRRPSPYSFHSFVLPEIKLLRFRNKLCATHPRNRAGGRSQAAHCLFLAKHGVYEWAAYQVQSEPQNASFAFLAFSVVIGLDTSIRI